MRTRCGAFATVLTGLISTACVLAQATAGQHVALDVKASGLKSFYVDDQSGSSQVSFTSQAPIEDFTGVGNKVKGECKFDPRAVESFVGKFSIRVDDLKSGVELRDSHMRGEDWLDGARYPEIVVEINRVDSAVKSTANSASLTLIGTCSFHGKSNPVSIPAVLAYLDETPRTQQKVKGDLIRLRAEFKVKLSDYGVTGPKGSDTIGLKVADELEIRAAVYGSTEPPPKPLQADRPASDSGSKRPAPPKRS